MQTGVGSTRASTPSLNQRIERLRRRSTYLIDPETQFRIAWQFNVILFCSVLLGLANIHAISSVLYLEVVDAYEAVVVYGWVAALAVISITLVVLLCVFFSHRVAGPAYNLAGKLSRMAEGDLANRVRLRDGDFLQDIALGVNKVNDRWRGSLDDIEQQVRRLRELAPDDPGLRRCIERLENVVNSYSR